MGPEQTVTVREDPYKSNRLNRSNVDVQYPYVEIRSAIETKTCLASAFLDVLLRFKLVIEHECFRWSVDSSLKPFWPWLLDGP